MHPSRYEGPSAVTTANFREFLLLGNKVNKGQEFSEVGGQGKGNLTIIDTVADLGDISTTPG
jgi:hypothetical protein